MDNSQIAVLGRFIRHGFEGHEYAHIEVVSVLDDSQVWVSDHDSITNIVPDKGRVIWFHPPNSIENHEMVFVSVKKAFSYNPEVGKFDKYHVDQYHIAGQIIDFSELEKKILTGLIANRELKCQTSAPVSKSYIKTSEELLVGPFTTKTNGDGTIEILDDDLTRIPAFPLPDASQTAGAGVLGVFLVPDPTKSPVDVRNFAPVEDLVSGLTRRLRKLGSKNKEALTVTQRLLEEYGRVIHQMDPNDPNHPHEVERQGRLDETLKHIEDSQMGLLDLAESLLSIPRIETELKQQIEIRLQDLAEAEKDTIAVLVQEEASKYDELLGKKNSLEREIDDLGTKAADLKKSTSEYERKCKEIFERYALALRNLDPEVLMPLQLSAVMTSTEPLPARRIEPSIAWEAQGDNVLPFKDARPRFQRACRAKALVPTENLDTLAVALFAKMFPAVSGDSADTVLNEMAHCLFGNRRVEVQCASDTSLSSAEFVSGLHTLFSRIQGDAPVLLVFNAANLIPANEFLIPLIRTYASSLQNQSPIFWNASSGSVLSLAWPSNVFAVAKLASGIEAYPVSKDYWQHGVHVDVSVSSASAEDEIEEDAGEFGEGPSCIGIAETKSIVACTEEHTEPVSRITDLLSVIGISPTEATWFYNKMIGRSQAEEEADLSSTNDLFERRDND